MYEIIWGMQFFLGHQDSIAKLKLKKAWDRAWDVGTA
jgi:hypothetical protein